MSPAFVSAPAFLSRGCWQATCMRASAGPEPIPTGLTELSIAGVGLACVDLVSTVAAFPEPDAKIRSVAFAEHGGGNAANALVAARRLGVRCKLVSALGDDYRGRWARAALAADGVDVRHVREIEGANTPFSYVIVDAEAGTRTCIHTADPRCTVAELDADAKRSVRDAAVLVVDGRYPDVAVAAARAARDAGAFVLVDAERVREGTDALLALAHGVVVKDSCARALAGRVDGDGNGDGDGDGDGEGSPLRNLAAVLGRGPIWVVATRGRDGCVLVRRVPADGGVGAVDLEVERVRVRRGEIAGGEFEAIHCDAVPGVTVVDGTGAGDAFLGALAYAVATKVPLPRALPLAAAVGAECCKAPGARASPRRERVAEALAAAHGSRTA